MHSIGAALLARKDQIHFFNDIGTSHPPSELSSVSFSLVLIRLSRTPQATVTIPSNIAHKVIPMHKENVGVTQRTTSITSGTPALDVMITSSSLAVIPPSSLMYPPALLE